MKNWFFWKGDRVRILMAICLLFYVNYVKIPNGKIRDFFVYIMWVY